jgi:hypothetical protein
MLDWFFADTGLDRKEKRMELQRCARVIYRAEPKSDFWMKRAALYDIISSVDDNTNEQDWEKIIYDRETMSPDGKGEGSTSASDLDVHDLPKVKAVAAKRRRTDSPNDPEYPGNSTRKKLKSWDTMGESDPEEDASDSDHEDDETSESEDEEDETSESDHEEDEESETSESDGSDQ